MINSKSNVLYHNLAKEYVTMVKGSGVFVYDDTGKKYLDGIGGVGVVNIGHGVEEILTILAEQSRKLAFAYSGIVDNEPQKQLAAKLQEWAPVGMRETKTIFSSGGAEANEAALKIAYQYHWERGNKSKYKVIGRWQSYHGDTVATLSMSGRTKWRSMHAPYLLDFPHISPPYCYRCSWEKSYPECNLTCARDLERVITQEGRENVAAFIAEPVIGTSMSAIVPPPGYYEIIRDICDEYDVLFIVDEVMSGVGRTGKKWGIDHWNVSPDIITASKGISGGYSPLGATIVNERIWQAIAKGSQVVMHGYTYGGNPISCAVGLGVLNYIEEHDLIVQAGQMGEKLKDCLKQHLRDIPYVGDIRGKGLFLGIELVEDRETKRVFPYYLNVSDRVVEKALENGLVTLGGIKGLLNGEGGDHFELTPPYIIDDENVEFIARTIRDSIVQTINQNLMPSF